MRVNNQFQPAVVRSNPNVKTNDLRHNGMKRKPFRSSSLDGGEGWGVVIGTALITMLVNSMLTCTGIIGQQVKALFPTTTNYMYLSLLNAVMIALWNFLGPVTCLLLGVFSSRTIALAGGILLSLGISLASQSYNGNIFFFTYAVVGGIGAGLVLNPGAMLLNRYFRKQKPLASGICLFISTSGQILFPHLIISLKNVFKPSGTILLLGGILLHVCVAGMLFRPGPSSCKGVSDMRHILTLNPTGHGQACMIQIRKSKSQRRKRKPSEKAIIVTGTPKNGKIVIPSNSLRLARIRTYSTGSRTSALPDIPEEQEPLENDAFDNKNQIGNTSNNRNQNNLRNNLHSVELDREIKRSQSFGSQLTYLATNSNNINIRHERRPRSRSENLGRISSIPTMTSSSKRPEAVNGAVNCVEKKKHPEAAICNIGLLSNPLYVLIVIASSAFYLSYPNVVFYTTIYEHQLGITDYKLALLLSLFVFCDMNSRLLIAWLLPQGFLRPQRIFLILTLLTLPSLSGELILISISIFFSFYNYKHKTSTCIL
uniref:Major facilitator superfamily (MFS) profile domain-containing protein n=1 Tax=Strigamia maritima TaxID=126957 RepID=T1JCF7_STRMM